MKRALVASAAALALVALSTEHRGSAQQASRQSVRATAADALRTWDTYVTQQSRAGALRLRAASVDPMMPARTTERLEQYHEGVRIWGAEIVRDAERGVATAIFGELAAGVAISTTPRLALDAGTDRLLGAGGAEARIIGTPELVVLPLDSGEYRLAYAGVVSGAGGVDRVFVDASTGAELLRYSEIQTQAPSVGSGRGVLGQLKKLSVAEQGGAFFTDDRLRPPVLLTFDMRGDLPRTKLVLDGLSDLLPADRATDTDNDWTDIAAVDAHSHIGWTYDFLFRRFARRGLDDNNRPIVTLINAVTQQGALTLPLADLVFAVNAFWCGVCGPDGIGVMYFGNGIPPQFFLSSTGNNYTYFAGALDIAAHELAHGVTDSSSRLIYRNESGALNESFSDIIGTAVEFFFHPAGAGPGTADYVLGEDISRARRAGARDGDRSLEDPALYGDPDHYSRRYTGTLDNGGVHVNSGISNHAYYLAIEGGTNRTSGLAVQGVGVANREQIERAFYRAFVYLLPSNATFATARAATIQAARDLSGAGSAAERAITQAWTAVGVN